MTNISSVPPEWKPPCRMNDLVCGGGDWVLAPPSTANLAVSSFVKWSQYFLTSSYQTHWLKLSRYLLSYLIFAGNFMHNRGILQINFNSQSISKVINQESFNLPLTLLFSFTSSLDFVWQRETILAEELWQTVLILWTTAIIQPSIFLLLFLFLSSSSF